MLPLFCSITTYNTNLRIYYNLRSITSNHVTTCKDKQVEQSSRDVR